jgi:spermidine synthase
MVDFSERGDLAILLMGLEPIESYPAPPQTIALYRHPVLGRVLVINGEVQHVEAWQALYHEPLVHVPASFVEDVRLTLVLGGGSLYAAQEALRYPGLQRCLLVDHDPRVLELMVRHYVHAQAVARDYRFEFVACSVEQFITSCSQHFDLIINDWANLVDTAWSGRDPFAALTRLLTIEGVCADVMYRHVFDHEHVARTRAALQPTPPTAYSLVTVPEYPGVLHLLSVWGSKYVSQCAVRPRNITQIRWLDRHEPSGLEFYNPQFLAFYLYLPPYLRRAADTL